MNLGLVILGTGGAYEKAFRQALDDKFKQLLVGNEKFDLWPAAKKSAEESLTPIPTPKHPINQSLPSKGYVGVYYNSFYMEI